MKTYVLNRDWAPFKKGDVFSRDDDSSEIYVLKDNDAVLARVPDGYLDEQGCAWRPGEGETYYFIDNDGTVNADDYAQHNAVDMGRLSIGNCFRTEEEANAVATWLKARKRLIDSGAKFSNGAGKTCFGVWYSQPCNRLGTYCRTSNEDSHLRDKGLCFDDEQQAEDSIKRHKEDWLIYLGVKENE